MHQKRWKKIKREARLATNTSLNNPNLLAIVVGVHTSPQPTAPS